MAKGDKGFERQQIQNEQAKSDELYGGFYDTLNKERSELRKRADEERGFLNTGYQQFANTGGLSPEDEARLRAVGAGGGGGPIFDPTEYVNKFKDPNRLADVRDTASRLKGFSAFSPESRGEIQRQHYRDLESTGGYSDMDVRKMKQSAGSVAPSFYSGIKDQMGRGLQVQGNANRPAFGASNFQLLRDASKAATEGSLNTDLAIKDKILAGKLTGADRLSQNEMQMRAIGAPLEMQGLQSAGSLGLGIDDNDYRNLSAAAGMEENYANSQAARSASSAAANSALEKYILEARNSGKMYGLDSLRGLYGETPGELSQNDELRLGAIGQRGNEMQGWRDRSLNNDQINRSRIGEYIVGGIGGLGGVAGAFAHPAGKAASLTSKIKPRFPQPTPRVGNINW